MANFQTVCDSADCPDTINQIQQAIQEATSSSTLSSRLTGKFRAMLEAIGVINHLDPAKIDALGGRDEVKRLVGEAYDTWIAPIDLPWVPAIIETTVVDPFLRSMLLRIVDEVYDRMGS